ncbi:MAG: hypothetical protein RIT27_341 [Pseudomonadota bacterium]|jgi:hypothetical protein
MSIPYNDPAPTLEDIWRLFRETDRKFQETGAQMKETDRKFQETERMIQENAAQLKETERLLRQQIGDLSRRLGEFVEGMIKPAAVRLFKERGIEVHKVTQKVEANNPQLNLATEIDLLVVNGDCCILIEVKSNLSIDDVNEHIERMAKFKPLFPEYANKKALGAVAGMVLSESVAKYAYRKGFFVIGQKGDSAFILNDQKFQPLAW